MSSSTAHTAPSASWGELAGDARREQTRARYPDEQGYVEREGVRLFYEVYGEGEPTVLLLPPWSIVHSRSWKMQIPYLARHFRVVTLDGRGNGKSDRPPEPDAYLEQQYADDTLAVMDVTGTDRAVLVSLSRGIERAMLLAAQHPERVIGMFVISPALPLPPTAPRSDAEEMFNQPRDSYEGWQKWNRNHWLEDYQDFLDFFFSKVFSEPHSTKQREDAVGWGLETEAETLVATQLAPRLPDEASVRALADRIDCPVLVLHGSEDTVRPHGSGAAFAELVGGAFVTLEGAGHSPHGRDPVKVNLLLRDFVRSSPPPRRWTRAGARRRRALYISSPIGLGHARRDVAIARQLRALAPDLEIDWLAQDPVTHVLAQAGERVHPASVHLAGESAHVASESSGHELPVFQAIRRMDEILLSNFMVFRDVVAEEHYDLWIGDEAWDIDYFLHENPELKTAAYVWLTDFVGWLPMREGGEHEAALTADYNAEMIEHIARYPRVRDRSIFVGEPEDVVPDTFGPGLPAIREWTERHFSFSGYITGFDAMSVADRAALRADLGYEPGKPVCLVTVGGSGVGDELLRRVMASLPHARQLVPELRMVIVAGPRIDPATLGGPAEGIEIHRYVPDLHRHLAACDVALVQGGLTTTMELTAARRPFIYFPLARHFEQNLYVRHRLERYRAGRRMELSASPPEAIADAIAAEIGREVDYLPVPADGAARAAEMIAELI